MDERTKTPRELKVREECESRKGALWQAPDRQHFLMRCRDIVDYLLPQAGPIMGEQNTSAADARWRNIFDTCATEALGIAVAGLMSYAFPNGGEWRTLKLRGVSEQSQGMTEWLSETDEVMEDTFEQSNVYRGISMLARDVRAFGQGVAIADYDDLYTLWLYHVPVGDYALAVSHRGQIDTMYRELSMTLRAVVDRWGEASLSRNLRLKWKEGPKSWDLPVSICHAIEPRPKDQQQGAEAKQQGLPELNSEMAWRSVYWERDSAKTDGLLSESGYPLFPVLTPREDVLPGSVYGYGSGCIALSHVRALQHRHFRLGTLIDWQSDAAFVLPTAARNQPWGPGERIYVDTPNPHAFAVQVGATGKSDLLLADIQDVRRQIRTTMGADVFSMISSLEGGNIRQEHILALREEKMAILGPQTARFLEELPRPLVDIAFSYMQRRGIVPELPQDLLEAGGIIDIELHGPLARASAAAKKAANDSFVYSVTSLIEAFPEIRHKVKAFEVANAYHETSGAEPKMLASDEEAGRLLEAEQQARAAAEQAAAMESMAKTGAALGSIDTSKPNGLSDVRQLMQQGAA